MVKYVPPGELSENIIDLRPQAGAAGRAVNRLRRSAAADLLRRQFEEMMRRELEAQLRRVRASRRP